MTAAKTIRLAPCVECGRPVHPRFQRCGMCTNTTPNLSASGLRRLYEETLR